MTTRRPDRARGSLARRPGPDKPLRPPVSAPSIGERRKTGCRHRHRNRPMHDPLRLPHPPRPVKPAGRDDFPGSRGRRLRALDPPVKPAGDAGREWTFRASRRMTKEGTGPADHAGGDMPAPRPGPPSSVAQPPAGITERRSLTTADHRPVAADRAFSSPAGAGRPGSRAGHRPRGAPAGAGRPER